MRPTIATFAAAAFCLAASPPALAADAKPAAERAEKKICKRDLDTGSLVRGTKRCFTAAEWNRVAESQRTGATRMIDELSTRPGCAGAGC